MLSNIIVPMELSGIPPPHAENGNGNSEASLTVAIVTEQFSIVVY